MDESGVAELETPNYGVGEVKSTTVVGRPDSPLRLREEVFKEINLMLTGNIVPVYFMALAANSLSQNALYLKWSTLAFGVPAFLLMCRVMYDILRKTFRDPETFKWFGSGVRRGHFLTIREEVCNCMNDLYSKNIIARILITLLVNLLSLNVEVLQINLIDFAGFIAIIIIRFYLHIVKRRGLHDEELRKAVKLGVEIIINGQMHREEEQKQKKTDEEELVENCRDETRVSTQPRSVSEEHAGRGDESKSQDEKEQPLAVNIEETTAVPELESHERDPNPRDESRVQDKDDPAEISSEE